MLKFTGGLTIVRRPTYPGLYPNQVAMESSRQKGARYMPWMKKSYWILRLIRNRLDLFHHQGVAAVIVVFRPGTHTHIPFLLIQPDGRGIVQAHAQTQAGGVQPFFTFQQEQARDALASVLRQDTQRGDPGHAFRAARVTGDEADHAPVYDRFQADDLRKGQYRHQVQQGPGVLGETGLFHVA